jgi:hypothetical protein
MTTAVAILALWIAIGLALAWVIGGAASLVGRRPGEEGPRPDWQDRVIFGGLVVTVLAIAVGML